MQVTLNDAMHKMQILLYTVFQKKFTPMTLMITM